jgi:hypothetical protein
MASFDVKPEVILGAGALVLGAYLYTLKKAGGAGRTIVGGTRKLYRDVTSVPKTAYRDVAKPVGRATKSVGRGVKSTVKGGLGWLKRRF